MRRVATTIIAVLLSHGALAAERDCNGILSNAEVRKEADKSHFIDSPFPSLLRWMKKVVKPEKSEKSEKLDSQERREEHDRWRERWKNRRENEGKGEHDSSSHFSRRGYSPMKMSEGRRYEGEESSEVVTKFFDAAQSMAMRRYGSSNDVVATLGTLMDSFRALAEKHEYLAEAGVQRAHDIQYLKYQLEMSKVTYDSIENLAIKILHEYETKSPNFKHSVRYLESILNVIALGRPLTSPEVALRDGLKVALQKLDAQNTATVDQKTAQAFLSQLVGPLSKESIRRQFMKGDIFDWTRFSKAIQGKELDHFLIMSRLENISRLLLFHTLSDGEQWLYAGPKVIISEAEPVLEPALGMEYMEHFHRDGVPSRYDVVRLHSGDLLQRTYRDRAAFYATDHTQPKVVTILIADISPSMKGDADTNTPNKTPVRDALMAAYYDQAKAAMDAGLANYVVYQMLFSGIVNESKRVATNAEYTKEFERFRYRQIEAQGGTNITKSLVSAFELIHEHQKNGGDAQFANIVLITDGEDRLDVAAIRAARDKIGPEVSIAVNAINLGEANGDIRNLVSKPPETELGLKKMTFQHITYDDIRELTNVGLQIEAVTQVAKDELTGGEHDKVTREEIVDIHDKLMNLAVRREERWAESQAAWFDARLWLQSTEPGMDDAELESTVKTVRAIEGTPIFSEYMVEERAALLMEFLGIVGQKYDLSVEGVIKRMQPDSRRGLLKWLKDE